MKELVFTRESIVWLVLLALTFASWELGTLHGVQIAGTRIEGSVMIILAFIKVHLVINNFMEVRCAPIALKICCNVWVLGVASVMLFMYNG